MPSALYWAYAALLRYQFRVNSYFFLLTSEYPRGMFGDTSRGHVPAAPPFAPQWPSGTPAAPPRTTRFRSTAHRRQPLRLPLTSESPAPADADPATGRPTRLPTRVAAAAPAPPPPAMPPPSPWDRVSPPPPSGPSDRSRLVLPSAARGWLIFAIVWGIVVSIAETCVQHTTATQYNGRQRQRPAHHRAAHTSCLRT